MPKLWGRELGSWGPWHCQAVGVDDLLLGSRWEVLQRMLMNGSDGVLVGYSPGPSLPWVLLNF